MAARWLWGRVKSLARRQVSTAIRLISGSFYQGRPTSTEDEWRHSGEIDIVQGEDMGSRSLIKAQFPEVQASSIRISGTVRNTIFEA